MPPVPSPGPPPAVPAGPSPPPPGTVPARPPAPPGTVPARPPALPPSPRPVAPAPTPPPIAPRPGAEGTDRVETGEDRETQERWARLAAADVGEQSGTARRRRSRVFRDNDRPRRPLRSTQEANAVAARRKEQITGTATSADASASEPADASTPIDAVAPVPAPAGDAPSASTPTIRASRAAGTSGDRPLGAGAPNDDGQSGLPDAAQEQGGSALETSPETTGAAGAVPADANGSGATQPTDSGNGTAPAGTSDDHDGAGDHENRRRGLLRRGRNKRKSGEG